VSCRQTVGSVMVEVVVAAVAIVAVGRLGAELDLEGDVVDSVWLEDGRQCCGGSWSNKCVF
jgi:hypothetical protein